MQRQAFGRRPATTKLPRDHKPVSDAPSSDDAELDQPDSFVTDAAPSAPPVDEEMRAWTKERQRHLFHRIPWRPLYLMASLSFGIASFVLPDSVNDSVDWLLYLLAGASLWAWWRGRAQSNISIG
jgi:hypothetical protein